MDIYICRRGLRDLVLVINGSPVEGLNVDQMMRIGKALGYNGLEVKGLEEMTPELLGLLIRG